MTTLEVGGPAGEEDSVVASWGQDASERDDLQREATGCALVDSPQVGKALGTQFSLKKARRTDDLRQEKGDVRQAFMRVT